MKCVDNNESLLGGSLTIPWLVSHVTAIYVRIFLHSEGGGGGGGSGDH